MRMSRIAIDPFTRFCMLVCYYDLADTRILAHTHMPQFRTAMVNRLNSLIGMPVAKKPKRNDYYLPLYLQPREFA